MRPLTEQEAEAVMTKLAKYIGQNTKHLLSRTDEEWVFRRHKSHVWYLRKALEALSSNVARTELHGVGVCFGKFTHHDNFRLVVTCLDFLAQYAPYKVWVRPNQEQSFLYGKNITRAGLGRITEGTPQYQGVIVFSMADVPLGFGVAALSTIQCRNADSNAYVVFHECDIGEYLRDEEHLT
eukprot:TRINITY_DN66892_c0_g1_i1.p2 TRINITY_DN66892_c0_g1~~TRINITY_DN66892_c0_g1_i1.p2  ORF type:complete len:181 (-),score=43.02 TRINITY_DN66892_c0_g1_i1:125-667(-)